MKVERNSKRNSLHRTAAVLFILSVFLSCEEVQRVFVTGISLDKTELSLDEGVLHIDTMINGIKSVL